MEAYIADINEMLFMTYIHGGDSGGPYDSNIKGVINAVKRFLIHAGLEDKYFLGETNRNYNNGIYFNVPQIIKKVIIDNP